LRSLLRSLVLLAGLALSGCYETTVEVIPANLAEDIPFNGDHATSAEGGEMWLARVAFSRDYRFREHRGDGEVRIGTFRAMRIRGDIFAVQIRIHGDPSYGILFFRIWDNGFGPVSPVLGTNLEALAERYGATYTGELDEDDDEGMLSGAPEAMLDFIRAHAGVDFERRQ
jgi:hypothetical protein